MALRSSIQKSLNKTTPDYRAKILADVGRTLEWAQGFRQLFEPELPVDPLALRRSASHLPSGRDAGKPDPYFPKEDLAAVRWRGREAATTFGRHSAIESRLAKLDVGTLRTRFFEVEASLSSPDVAALALSQGFRQIDEVIAKLPGYDADRIPLRYLRSHGSVLEERVQLQVGAHEGWRSGCDEVQQAAKRFRRLLDGALQAQPEPSFRTKLLPGSRRRAANELLAQMEAAWDTALRESGLQTLIDEERDHDATWAEITEAIEDEGAADIVVHLLEAAVTTRARERQEIVDDLVGLGNIASEPELTALAEIPKDDYRILATDDGTAVVLCTPATHDAVHEGAQRLREIYGVGAEQSSGGGWALMIDPADFDRVRRTGLRGRLIPELALAEAGVRTVQRNDDSDPLDLEPFKALASMIYQPGGWPSRLPVGTEFQRALIALDPNGYVLLQDAPDHSGARNTVLVCDAPTFEALLNSRDHRGARLFSDYGQSRAIAGFEVPLRAIGVTDDALLDLRRLSSEEPDLVQSQPATDLLKRAQVYPARALDEATREEWAVREAFRSAHADAHLVHDVVRSIADYGHKDVLAALQEIGADRYRVSVGPLGGDAIVCDVDTFRTLEQRAGADDPCTLRALPYVAAIGNVEFAVVEGTGWQNIAASEQPLASWSDVLSACPMPAKPSDAAEVVRRQELAAALPDVTTGFLQTLAQVDPDLYRVVDGPGSKVVACPPAVANALFSGRVDEDDPRGPYHSEEPTTWSSKRANIGGGISIVTTESWPQVRSLVDAGSGMGPVDVDVVETTDGALWRQRRAAHDRTATTRDADLSTPVTMSRTPARPRIPDGAETGVPSAKRDMPARKSRHRGALPGGGDLGL